MHLTLLIPEFLWPEPNDQLTFGDLPDSGFAWLDARARFAAQPALSFEQALARCFGLDQAVYAPLRLLGETTDEITSESTQPNARNGFWLCADPVHLRFHHERVVLADAGAFELSDDEAGEFIDSLNATFADVGCFHRADTRRWYLQLNAAVDHRAEPISAIAGKRIAGDPVGQKSPLAGLINEIQMFLHAHPANQRRAQAGHPAVISLWLWGGGSLPALVERPFDSVWSDDPLARGLARTAGLNERPAAERLDTLLAEARPGEKALVVVDRLLGPVLYENPDDWRAAWQALEADWLVPFAENLGRQVKSLRLVAPTIYGTLEWQSDGSGRWQFWKKGRTPAAVAQALSA